MDKKILFYLSLLGLLSGSIQAQELAPVEREAVVITADRDPDVYTSPETTTGGLKTDTPLLETPQAISVVTSAIIEDQDARDLEDVLRNVAGVSIGGTYDGWDYYRIRGFDSSFNTFWDGLRGDNGLSPELYGVERVEVIKGPASTLYGQAPLGGLVNIVSKRPKKEFGGEVSVTAGSWDYYKAELDINIPLLVPSTSTYTPPSGKGAKDVTPVTTNDSDIGIYARVVALYKNAGSYIDHFETERFFIAPSITFEFGEDTSLTILSEYKRDWGKFAMPLPALGTVLPNTNGEIPMSRYLGLPNTNDIEQERFKIGYDFKHKFNDVVALRQNLSYSHMDQTWSHALYPSALAPDERTLYLYPYSYDNVQDRFGVDTAVDITFDTGPVKHSITLGVDYYHNEGEYSSRQIDYGDFPGSYVAIDLFKPRYRSFTPRYASNTSGETVDNMLGFYLQEHAKLGNFTLTLGGRYDKFWNNDTFEGVTNENDQDAFTPKAGITYEFVPGFAAYANYSRSFNPQWSAKDSSGKPVDPEEGENLEAGLKYHAFDGRLTGLISVFQLTRENVATANPATADPFDATVSGEQRSRGFEFETAAQLLPGLTLTAAYTYIDAEVTQDNTIAEGTPLQGVPEHAFNIWLKYTVQDGPLKGFGVGLGGRYYTEQSGDTNNTFELPSYGLIDAALYYEREDFSVQVNFNNIADKRYFVGSYNDLYVNPGIPFNISASVTWKF